MATRIILIFNPRTYCELWKLLPIHRLMHPQQPCVPVDTEQSPGVLVNARPTDSVVHIVRSRGVRSNLYRQTPNKSVSSYLFGTGILKCNKHFQCQNQYLSFKTHLPLDSRFLSKD